MIRRDIHQFSPISFLSAAFSFFRSYAFLFLNTAALGNSGRSFRPSIFSVTRTPFIFFCLYFTAISLTNAYSVQTNALMHVSISLTQSVYSSAITLTRTSVSSYCPPLRSIQCSRSEIHGKHCRWLYDQINIGWFLENIAPYIRIMQESVYFPFTKCSHAISHSII